jgi:hypothetical protein
MPATKTKKNGSSLPGNTSQNLQTFSLLDLQQFTFEKTYSTTPSNDLHLFFVGRDDVHDIINYVLSRVSVSLYLNMYGYDDADLNKVIMSKIMDPNIIVLITLDKTQTSTKTEKMLLASDQTQSLTAFNTHFVIGSSATGQITHTKGFVADGKVAAEGSTNWSQSGEGIGQPGTPGYKAQNNTQSIITDPDTISRFSAELIREHMAAQQKAVTDPTMSSSLKRSVKK